MPRQGREAVGVFLFVGGGFEELESSDRVRTVNKDKGILSCVFAGGVDRTVELLNLAGGQIGAVLPSGNTDQGMIDHQKIAEQVVGQSFHRPANHVCQADGTGAVLGRRQW